MEIGEGKRDRERGRGRGRAMRENVRGGVRVGEWSTAGKTGRKRK